MPLMTSFKPGQSPPQVTITALTSAGWKKRCFLGPAFNHFLAYSIEKSGPNEF